MQFTAQQINQIIKGEIVGNPNVLVCNIAKIEKAQKGDICFIANPKYESFLYETAATIVIINNDLKIEAPVSATLIKVSDAYTAFSTLLEQFNSIEKQKLDKKGIEAMAFVHPSAQIGKDVYIGAFAYIAANTIIGDHTKIYSNAYIGDECEVGNHCLIYSGVKIYHQVKIANEVIIHSNAVIGSDGFGFAPQEDGSYQKIAQTGTVIIEDRVEIGANTCIDRATLGATIIRQGVKLDNLIQVGHNVEIEKNTVIAAQTGISGSTKIGENCVLGGQIGVGGHLTIAKGNQFGAKSGINSSIKEEGKQWNGYPLLPYRDWLKSAVAIKQLHELKKQIEDLEKKLVQLT